MSSQSNLSSQEATGATRQAQMARELFEVSNALANSAHAFALMLKCSGLGAADHAEKEVLEKVQDISTLARDAHRAATDLIDSHDFTEKQAG